MLGIEFGKNRRIWSIMSLVTQVPGERNGDDVTIYGLGPSPGIYRREPAGPLLGVCKRTNDNFDPTGIRTLISPTSALPVYCESDTSDHAATEADESSKPRVDVCRRRHCGYMEKGLSRSNACPKIPRMTALLENQGVPDLSGVLPQKWFCIQYPAWRFPHAPVQCFHRLLEISNGGLLRRQGLDGRRSNESTGIYRLLVVKMRLGQGEVSPTLTYCGIAVCGNKEEKSMAFGPTAATAVEQRNVCNVGREHCLISSPVDMTVATDLERVSTIFETGSVVRRCLETRKYGALKDKSYSVGRGRGCDLMITESQLREVDLKELNDVHFKIKKKDDTVTIENLSRLGTFINGRKLDFGRKIDLKHNDRISVLRPQLKGNKQHTGKSWSITCYQPVAYTEITWETGDKMLVYLNSVRVEENPCPEDIKSKYAISYVLGAGGFGEVSLIFEKETCMKFALKKITKRPNQLKYISRETDILRKLDHPCVVHMEDISDTPETLYIVLEFMEGGDLAGRIRTLTERTTKLIFYQLVLAVQYLHSKNIAHRDIKPENILLASENTDTLVKVTDFGISKIEEGTELNTGLGTLYYVAPEILRTVKGNTTYTNKVDIWSMGVVLFQW
uniref:non-specific serine/threonine protein kinase n=1 Tax=Timema bartmani TaxID=61472 RepID=A0A7R9HYY4_9NEOP|nr:unnamed protein product [Timema bartmani]